VDVTEPGQLDSASVLVFPGVGAFGSAMEFLESRGFKEPLLRHIRAGKPYMGICLGMQTLFEASEETEGGLAGLGVIPGDVARFARSSVYSVPHIGWNGLTMHKPCQALAMVAPADRVYFVHSYRARPTVANADFVAATCDYGDGPFIAAVARGNIFATQFHPEKSGALGLAIFRAFLDAAIAASSAAPPALSVEAAFAAGTMSSPCWPAAVEADAASSAASGRPRTCLAKRVIA
jgi:glutamine amidotransferase/cyclase